MIRTQLFIVVAVGLVATACTYSSTTLAVVPAGPQTVSDQDLRSRRWRMALIGFAVLVVAASGTALVLWRRF